MVLLVLNVGVQAYKCKGAGVVQFYPLSYVMQYIDMVLVHLCILLGCNKRIALGCCTIIGVIAVVSLFSFSLFDHLLLLFVGAASCSEDIDLANYHY